MNRVTTDPVIREFAQAVRNKLGAHVRNIILFGSRARGPAWEGADYDIAVVAEQRDHEAEKYVLDAAAEMLDRHDALVSAHVFSTAEWEIEQLTPLGLNIGKEGLAI